MWRSLIKKVVVQLYRPNSPSSHFYGSASAWPFFKKVEFAQDTKEYFGNYQKLAKKNQDIYGFVIHKKAVSEFGHTISYYYSKKRRGYVLVL